MDAALEGWGHGIRPAVARVNVLTAGAGRRWRDRRGSGGARRGWIICRRSSSRGRRRCRDGIQIRIRSSFGRAGRCWPCRLTGRLLRLRRWHRRPSLHGWRLRLLRLLLLLVLRHVPRRGKLQPLLLTPSSLVQILSFHLLFVFSLLFGHAHVLHELVSLLLTSPGLAAIAIRSTSVSVATTKSHHGRTPSTGTVHALLTKG